MTGITQFIRLALDRAMAAKAEEELRQALKRGTDPKAAEQNLSRVERKFDSLVGVAKKAGAAMLGFFAIRQVGAFASEMFNLGTAAEETASKFETVFGPADAQVQTFLDSWARLAGLNKTVARDMAATAAITVQGMGASKEASAGFAEQVMRLAGDLASMHNQTTPEMFDRIRAGLSGQMEPLSRFTGMISAADIQVKALSMTGKAHESQLTALEKAQASLTVMYERSGVALGDLERTQDSTANRAKALQADFDNLKIEIAKSLMPAFERLVGFLIESQPAIASFGNAMVTMIEYVGAELQAFARDLRIVQGLWYDLKDMARNPIQWFSGPGAKAAGTSGLDFDAHRKQMEEAARIMAERRATRTGTPGATGTGGGGGTAANVPAVVAQIRAETDLNALITRQVELRRAVNTETDKGRKVTLQLELKEIAARIGELKRGTADVKRDAAEAKRARQEAQQELAAEIALIGEAREMGLAGASERERANELERQLTAQLSRSNLTLKERLTLQRKLNDLAEQRDKEDTIRMQREDRIANQGPGFAGTLAMGRANTSADLRGPSVATQTLAAEITRRQAKQTEAYQQWMDQHADMLSATQSVASGVMSAWEQAFTMILDGTGTVGNAFTAMGRGMVSSIADAFRQLAGLNVAKEIASAFTSAAGSDLRGVAAHLLAATKWAALGALAGGVGGAISASGGRGGADGHRGSGTYGRDAANRTQPQNITYVYVDPFDPRNPVHSRQVGKAVELHVELAGRPDWAR